MSVTGSIMAGVGLAGSIGGAAIGASAAGNAADTQANAAEYNAQLQAELGQEQLAYEAAQYGNTLNLERPWLQSGANSLSTLDYLLGLGGAPGNGGQSLGNGVAGGMPNAPGGGVSLGTGIPGGNGAGGFPRNPQAMGIGGVSGTPIQAGNGTSLSVPGVSGTVNVPQVGPLAGTANTNLGAFGSLMGAYPGGQFQAPTLQQAEQAPGYQFALDQGEKAIQSSAAANGSLLTGGTMNALDQYAQGLATTNYNNIYNQALNTYDTNYNVWSNNQANMFNRLASMAGMGQTTAQQLGNAGMNSASQVGSILGDTGRSIAQQNSNAAAATASGYVGAGNAWGGALNSGMGNLSQLLMLQQLMGGNSQSFGDIGGY